MKKINLKFLIKPSDSHFHFRLASKSQVWQRI